MNLKHILIVTFACLLTSLVLGQDNVNGVRSIQIKEAQGKITLDGELDDPGWKGADVQSGFWMQAPEDGTQAQWQTEIMVAYDGGGIYVAAKMHDENGQINGTLKRDRFPSSDGFGVVIDPTGQKTNGFAFGTNARNAQSEVLIAIADPDDSWDNKWRSASKSHAQDWTIEYYIPFSSLRFNADSKEWGINFFRRELGLNETYIWSPTPRQFDPLDLGYCGKLIWDKVPGKQKTNVSLIPYLSNNLNQSPNDDPSIENKINIGGDAKIGITSGLNLDLTFNPDFSQVDIDQFQTNLTRFNIFFPERRQDRKSVV